MGKKQPQNDLQTMKVLGAFASPRDEGLSGAEIARSTGLQSGTLYPILFRLEQAGWLESEWEEGEASYLGRPKRRLYRITAVGVKSAQGAHRQVADVVGGLAWIG